MFNNFLVIIGACSAMAADKPITEWQCVASTEQATLARYERLVDCVRDREALEVEAYCFGEPFNPFDQRG